MSTNNKFRRGEKKKNPYYNNIIPIKYNIRTCVYTCIYIYFIVCARYWKIWCITFVVHSRVWRASRIKYLRGRWRSARRRFRFGLGGRRPLQNSWWTVAAGTARSVLIISFGELCLFRFVFSSVKCGPVLPFPPETFLAGNAHSRASSYFREGWGGGDRSNPKLVLKVWKSKT